MMGRAIPAFESIVALRSCSLLYSFSAVSNNRWTEFALINEDSVFRLEVSIRILLSRFTFGAFQKTKRQLPLCCNKIR